MTAKDVEIEGDGESVGNVEGVESVEGDAVVGIVLVGCNVVGAWDGDKLGERVGACEGVSEAASDGSDGAFVVGALLGLSVG